MTGTLSLPITMPSISLGFTWLYHSWFRISGMVIRFVGSVFNTFYINSFDDFEMNPGMRQSQFRIFLQSLLVFGSSNGRYPHVIAYKIIPQLHMSEFNPWYLLPAIISGAAQHGDPHAVLRVSPSPYTLDSPKSTIFILF